MGADTGADRNGTIGLDEFVGLWGYLNQWKGLFARFDADNNGSIDRGEFAVALGQFGYHLSDGFVGVLFTSYDKKGTPSLSPCPPMTLLGSSRLRLANFREQGTG
jgi:peflin